MRFLCDLRLFFLLNCFNMSIWLNEEGREVGGRREENLSRTHPGGAETRATLEERFKGWGEEHRPRTHPGGAGIGATWGEGVKERRREEGGFSFCSKLTRWCILLYWFWIHESASLARAHARARVIIFLRWLIFVRELLLASCTGLTQWVRYKDVGLLCYWFL